MNLGETIRMLRKERKIKLKELASLAGISNNALAAIEKDRSMPTKATFQKICEGLGVSVAYVLARTITEEDLPPQKREVFRILMPLFKEQVK